MKRLLYVLIAVLSPVLMGQGYSGGSSTSVPAGTGTGSLTVGGVLCKGAPAAATAGTTEEVLATCTIPAATLAASGSTVRVILVAHTTANANNKQLRVRVGGVSGTLVLDLPAAAANNNTITTTWPLVIQRTGATTATVNGSITRFTTDSTSAAVGASNYTALRAAAITWANAQDLVITGTTPTSAGDLTLDSYTVEVVQ